jgi:hypothetical protein
LTLPYKKGVWSHSKKSENKKKGKKKCVEYDSQK